MSMSAVAEPDGDRIEPAPPALRKAAAGHTLHLLRTFGVMLLLMAGALALRLLLSLPLVAGH